MEALFASGRIVELILGLVVIEGIVLVALRARTGRGPALIPLTCNLAAGAGLMLALRASLVGAAWTGIAGWMLVALAAHVGEMAWRLSRRVPAPATKTPHPTNA